MRARLTGPRHICLEQIKRFSNLSGLHLCRNIKRSSKFGDARLLGEESNASQSTLSETTNHGGVQAESITKATGFCRLHATSRGKQPIVMAATRIQFRRKGEIRSSAQLPL